MVETIDDLILLLLLILFFGREQSQRPERYYRFWFAGWIFVFLSYVVWEIPLTRIALDAPLLDAVRFDFVLLGGLTFLLSMLAAARRFRWTVLRGLAVGIPVALLIDAERFVAVPKAAMVLGIVAWEVYGLYASQVLLPTRWRRRRTAVGVLCAVYGIVMIACVWSGRRQDLPDWTLSEVYGSAALLYGGTYSRSSFAGRIGTLGFLLWATFYPLAILFESSAMASAQGLHTLYQFWNFPKYFVGFAMILKVSEDTTGDKNRSMEAFKKLYEDFRQMYRDHPYPMWIYAPENGRFLSANTAAIKEYGYSEDEFLTRTAEDLQTREEAMKTVDNLFPRAEGGGIVRHRRKDGSLLWADTSDCEILFRGSVARMMQAQDITERIEVSRELAHKAHHDALTGLPNRHLLQDRLQRCLDRCEREQNRAAVFTMDIDHFKQINDTYGHQAGDECLKAVAERLSSSIRQVDTIARTGGEEFTAVVGGLGGTQAAEKVAESLLASFKTSVRLGDLELAVTVSIGVAMYPEDGMDGDTLRHRSDEALYRAKRNGRNRAEYCWRKTEAMVAGGARLEEEGSGQLTV